MSDPFDIPPPRPPTLIEIIRDNIADLYDRDVGVKNADVPVLDDVVECLMRGSDKADYFFEAVTLWGDPAEYVDFMLKIMQIHKDMPEVQEITRCLRLTAQETLNGLEETISEEHHKAEAAMKEYHLESMALDNYQDKKGV